MVNLENDILVRVRFLYTSLPKAEKAVADLLLDEGESVVNYTISEYAERANSSDASILRFCKRLGFEGYTDFKQQLAELQTSTYDYGAYRINKEDDMQNIFRKIIWYYEKTLKDTLTLYSDDYDKALKSLQKAKTVYLFGIGDAHLVCQSLQMKLARIGLPCFAYSDEALMIASASLMTEEDLAIAVSFSGDTRTVVNAMKIAKKNGSKTVCIVHFEKSKLSKLCDIKLYTATTDMTAGHDEIARRSAEHAIVEALYMGLITKDPERFNSNIKKSISAIIANK